MEAVLLAIPNVHIYVLIAGQTTTGTLLDETIVSAVFSILKSQTKPNH
jgi:hypothetical protein